MNCGDYKLNYKNCMNCGDYKLNYKNCMNCGYKSVDEL